MKLTQEQLNQFLKNVGVQAVEVVDNEADSDFDLDKTITAVDANRLQILKPRIEAELKDGLVNTEIGRLQGTLNSVLAKTTGASRSELERIQDFNERIEYAIKHKASQLEGDAKDIEKRFTDLITQNEQEREKIKQEYEVKLNDANNRYTQRDIQNNLATMLSKAPLPDGADRLIAANDFQRHLSDKYHVVYDETAKSVKLFDKNNHSTPALNGNQMVDIMNEAKDYFTPRALWKTDMRDKNAKEELNKVTQPATPKPFNPERAQMSAIDRANAERAAYLEQKSGEAA